MLEIKPARPEDIKSLCALEGSCFSDPFGESALLDGVEYEHYLTLCAFREGKLCGYLAALFCLDEGELLRIAVAKEARRRGVGRALMQAFLEESRRREAGILRLEVRKSNEGAIALYKSLGFSSVGERRGYYKNPTEDAVLYERESPLIQ